MMIIILITWDDHAHDGDVAPVDSIIDGQGIDSQDSKGHHELHEGTKGSSVLGLRCFSHVGRGKESEGATSKP